MCVGTLQVGVMMVGLLGFEFGLDWGEVFWIGELHARPTFDGLSDDLVQVKTYCVGHVVSLVKIINK